jgi:hypothetical protein
MHTKREMILTESLELWELLHGTIENFQKSIFALDWVFHRLMTLHILL